MRHWLVAKADIVIGNYSQTVAVKETRRAHSCQTSLPIVTVVVVVLSSAGVGPELKKRDVAECRTKNAGEWL